MDTGEETSKLQGDLDPTRPRHGPRKVFGPVVAAEMIGVLLEAGCDPLLTDDSGEREKKGDKSTDHSHAPNPSQPIPL